MYFVILPGTKHTSIGMVVWVFAARKVENYILKISSTISEILHLPIGLTVHQSENSDPMYWHPERTFAVVATMRKV
jgi:hypothetical protein